MGEAIPGEDAGDGTDGGWGLNALSLQSPTNGLCTAREVPVIKMESFQDNDLLDLFSCSGESQEKFAGKLCRK